MNKQRIAILIACSIGALAALMSWQDYFLLSSSGVELGYGWFTLGLFVIAAIVCFLSDKTKQLSDKEIIGTIIPAVAALGVAVFAYIQLQKSPAQIKHSDLDFIVDMAKTFLGKATLGVGLYLTIIAAVAVPVLAFAMKNRNSIVEGK